MVSHGSCIGRILAFNASKFVGPSRGLRDPSIRRGRRGWLQCTEGFFSLLRGIPVYRAVDQCVEGPTSTAYCLFKLIPKISYPRGLQTYSIPTIQGWSHGIAEVTRAYNCAEGKIQPLSIAY